MKTLFLLLPVLSLSACNFFPPQDAPLSMEEQKPYVQKLLEANGLGEVGADSVVKILIPDDPHMQEWYIDLRDRDITSFTFTEDVKKLNELIRVIDLRDNELTSPPKGLNHRVWFEIALSRNKLCSLSRSDSTILYEAGGRWLDGQRCP